MAGWLAGCMHVIYVVRLRVVRLDRAAQDLCTRARAPVRVNENDTI